MSEAFRSSGVAFVNSVAGDGKREPYRFKNLRAMFGSLGIAAHSYNTYLELLRNEQDILDIPELLDAAHNKLLYIVGGDATHMTVPLWMYELFQKHGIQSLPRSVLIGGYGGQNQAAITLGTQPGLFRNKSAFVKELIGLVRDEQGDFRLVKPWIVNSSELTNGQGLVHRGKLVNGTPFLWTFGSGPYQRRALEEAETDRSRPHWLRATLAIPAAMKHMHDNHGKEFVMVRVGKGELTKAMDAFLVTNFNRWGAFRVGDDPEKSYIVLLGVNPEDMSAFELVTEVQLYLAKKTLKEFFRGLPEPTSPAVRIVELSDDEGVEFDLPNNGATYSVDSILRPAQAKNPMHSLSGTVKVTAVRDSNGVSMPIWNAPQKKC